LSNGGFVVTWMSSKQDASLGFVVSDIYAQRYDAEGVAQGSEFRANTYIDNIKNISSITALSNGGFVVAWESYGQDGGSSYDIYAQRYDADGVPKGGEFRINTYTDNNQTIPSITASSNGGFVVAWESSRQDGSRGGYLRSAL